MLRHHCTALGLLAAVGVLAACNDTPDADLTAPQLQLSALTCKPATAQKLARSFFGNGSPGLAFAQQLTTNQATNVSIVFNIFSEIANKANLGGLTALQKFNGANLTVQSIACAAVVSSDASVTGLKDTVAFRQALEITGAYEVRGRDGNDNANVKSHNAALSQTGASGIRAPAGVYPDGGFKAWQGGPVLFYGSPRTSNFSNEAPPVTGRVAFDWFTVKPLTAVTEAELSGAVGICVDVPVGAETKLRVQREQTILPITTFEVCPAVTVGREPTERPRTALAWFGRTFLAPAELHATTLLATTSPGASAKKFSPYEVVNPASVQLAFVHQPADGNLNATIPSVDAGSPIAVSAKGQQGTAWEGVSIQIFGLNNNGLKVPFANDIAVTDGTGIATFDAIASPKTGGFDLLAVTVPPGDDPDVANFAPDTVAAAQRINIRP